MTKGTRKYGKRSGKKGRRTMKKGSGFFDGVGTGIGKVFSAVTGVGRKLRPIKKPQPEMIDWKNSFSANRYSSGVFGYELDYIYSYSGSGDDNIKMIFHFDNAGAGQLMTKTKIMELLQKIGINKDKLVEGIHYAIGEGSFSSNKYWSITNVVTFNFIPIKDENKMILDSITITGKNTSKDNNANVDVTITKNSLDLLTNPTNPTNFVDAYQTLVNEYEKLFREGNLKIVDGYLRDNSPLSLSESVDNKGVDNKGVDNVSGGKSKRRRTSTSKKGSRRARR